MMDQNYLQNLIQVTLNEVMSNDPIDQCRSQQEVIQYHQRIKEKMSAILTERVNCDILNNY